MRYAIYATPPQQHPLTRAASAWLGRNAFPASAADPAADPEAARFADLTADPRRYGFHATLKAPFALAEGRTEAGLIAAFEAFCAMTPAVSIDRLVLRELGAFFALVPSGDAAALNALCARVVEEFEPFRAPLSSEDVARRKPELLSERQRELLQRWGYPYVFEEFRFHMTLTGPVPEDSRAEMREILRRRFVSFVDQALPIDHLALFCEPERGQPFHVLRAHSLAPAAGA